MKKIILALFLLTACQSTQTSSAQDWFGKATSILNSETSRNVLGTLGGNNQASSALSTTDISAGLREALRIGSTKVVSQVGRAGGFSNDSNIKIPLPGQLARVDSALSAIGMGSLTDDLKLRMNRAAELAAPKAKTLFINAISQMSIEDARGILTGPQDSATQYLRRVMGPQLLQDMQPLISSSLADAGAVKAYDSVIGRYSQIPFVPDAKANLNSYVGEKALDGIFYYVAQEEAAIRTNPAARTTDILKKVFAAAK